jgi:hypothetical protein
MLRLNALSLFAVMTLVALTGCSKSATDSLSPAGGRASGIEALRPTNTPNGFWNRTRLGISGVLFVHASPDAPNVDINLGWLPAARNLAFGQNTPYRFTLSGPRRIQVTVAGTRTTVIDATPTLAPRTFYTVFAIDKVANLAPLVLVDDLTPPAAGKAHVRFVHLSPDAPAVDVAVANGGPVVFGNKSFKDATAFTPLPAGKYDLEVRLAGTNTVVLPLPGIQLDAGRIYTVYAKGLVAGTGAQALGAGIVVNSPFYGYRSDDDAVKQAQNDAAVAAPSQD